MGDEIVRWKVDPLERSRRGLDERLLMAAPGLRRLVARVLRRPLGSPLRRALITRVLQVGFAAGNRGDYESPSSFLHRDFELHMRPDDRERAGDLEPLYRGPDGYVRAARAWKESFAEHRWELREIFDSGGPRFGARTEMVGRGLESGWRCARRSSTSGRSRTARLGGRGHWRLRRRCFGCSAGSGAGVGDRY